MARNWGRDLKPFRLGEEMVTATDNESLLHFYRNTYRVGADQSLMRGQENRFDYCTYLQYCLIWHREILFEEKRQLHAFLKSYEK